jgi:small subunit ribosomal protein S1
LKQLNAHPWDALDAKLAIDKVKGKVVVIADYGAIEVAEVLRFDPRF